MVLITSEQLDSVPTVVLRTGEERHPCTLLFPRLMRGCLAEG
jgi:hypothetical protein